MHKKTKRGGCIGSRCKKTSPAEELGKFARTKLTERAKEQEEASRAQIANSLYLRDIGMMPPGSTMATAVGTEYYLNPDNTVGQRPTKLAERIGPFGKPTPRGGRKTRRRKTRRRR